MLLSAGLGNSVYPVIPSNLEEMSVACQSGKIVSGGLHQVKCNATKTLVAKN
jgi:hypothetical protein